MRNRRDARVRDLLLGEFRALDRLPPLVVEDHRKRYDTLVLTCRRFRGGRHNLASSFRFVAS